MTVHSDARLWDDLWEVVKAGPSGGQATSKVARRRDGGVELGFVKILTRQDDTERRARFYREAAILESLDIDGVPKLIETNARHYENHAFNLYAVSTLVPGTTLRELRESSYTAEQAIGWTADLCEILRACREAGIRHRDIKPENCILSEDGKLYLVDFGLASDVNEQEGFETSVGQEIGNRFLRVPEFRPESANRDDPRTDLTLAVGILFFLLTRTNPRVLVDEQGRFPHQRGDVAAHLRPLDVPRSDRLMRIFDQGFQHDLDRRFQSAESLKDALLACLEREGPGQKADVLQNRILEHASSADVLHSKAMMERLHAINGQIHRLRDRMLGELGGVVSSLGGPIAHVDMSQGYLSFDTGFLYSRNTRAQIMLGFEMRHLGSEIVVTVWSNRVMQAEFRVPAASAELPPDDLDRIREIYLEKLSGAPGAI
ncbi:protein kinase [Hyphomicrobium sp. NDB2Meth4]|uniref:serine/threonine protein kinase n=1 Tax=Hyphomicrobium sp. NDB2Meth4 TaxID=1892846 RepID=UPI0009F9088F|nr:protein kinase [Hyphomicrobium sp. NDB2Meth4]